MNKCRRDAVRDFIGTFDDDAARRWINASPARNEDRRVATNDTAQRVYLNILHRNVNMRLLSARRRRRWRFPFFGVARPDSLSPPMHVLTPVTARATPVWSLSLSQSLQPHKHAHIHFHLRHGNDCSRHSTGFEPGRRRRCRLRRQAALALQRGIRVTCEHIIISIG